MGVVVAVSMDVEVNVVMDVNVDLVIVDVVEVRVWM